jgi:hypothetical protein
MSKRLNSYERRTEGRKGITKDRMDEMKKQTKKDMWQPGSMVMVSYE